MALQFSTTYRNALLDQLVTAVGTTGKLRIYSGSAPANCSTAASGTLLADISLANPYMASASGGTKAMTGTWSVTATGTGTAGYFRIWDSTPTTCHAQGTVTATGGGGDMTLDNTSIASGQTVQVTTFTLTAPGV